MLINTRLRAPESCRSIARHDQRYGEGPRRKPACWARVLKGARPRAPGSEALASPCRGQHHRLWHAVLGGEDSGQRRLIDLGHRIRDDLEQADPRLAQVAQMRYFGGYSEQEIAETLEVTEHTVQRDWEKARLILAAALR